MSGSRRNSYADVSMLAYSNKALISAPEDAPVMQASKAQGQCRSLF